ncbi:MAG TPA: ABC transporter permease [Gaiellaceae bacterium]
MTQSSEELTPLRLDPTTPAYEGPIGAVVPADRLTEITPPKRGLTLNLGELWAYRELLVFMVWRDIKVRYKQTVLGAAWAVIQPVSTVIIFSVIFGRLAHLPSDGLPYPVFAFAGLLPWLYFAQSLTLSSQSLVANKNLVTKVYFPRLIIPLAAVAVPVVDFLVASTVLIGMIFFYGLVPSWHAVGILLFVLLAFLTAFGVGLWLSVLNVRYRDVPYVIPFLTQLWLYASPVVYPVSLVPRHWQWLLALNPMVGVIEGFRWALLGIGTPRPSVILTSGAVGLLLTLSGLVYFNRMERHFADVI